MEEGQRAGTGASAGEAGEAGKAAKLARVRQDNSEATAIAMGKAIKG